MRNYKNYEVWKDGISLVNRIYHITSLFPKSETYSLQNQMRRAAVSVPSNLSSLFELNTQLIISEQINYIP